MAFGNTVNIVGNVTRDPELRYTPSGASVTNFSVAWNRRYERNGQQVEEVNFFDIVCWGSLADNVASSLTKGARVMVTGRLDQRSWETPQGEKRSKVEITADDVAPSLRWASVEIARNPPRRQFRWWRRWRRKLWWWRRRPYAESAGATSSSSTTTAGLQLRRGALLMAGRKPKRSMKPRENPRRGKKKVSVLTQEKIEYVDYKDVNVLRRFMSDRAKIRARRVTGNDTQQQR